jgi:hypothetical protein
VNDISTVNCQYNYNLTEKIALAVDLATIAIRKRCSSVNRHKRRLPIRSGKRLPAKPVEPSVRLAQQSAKW